MAYDGRKIITFGVVGVAIAAILIMAFLPVREEVRINPTVALQEIPGYGFQIVKISEKQANVVLLNVGLDGFEIRKTDGSWAEISVNGEMIFFNLLRDPEVSIVADVRGLNSGSYDAIRFRIVRGLEFTNSTLDTGEVISVDVPNNKIELATSTFEIGERTESLSVKLFSGSGILSNYMLPEIHLSIGTMKIEIIVSET
jgi:hypothetical protein